MWMAITYCLTFACTAGARADENHAPDRIGPDLRPYRDGAGFSDWTNAQWAGHEGLIASNRQWLGLLPRKAAEKIAFRNAARLFGREAAFENR